MGNKEKLLTMRTGSNQPLATQSLTIVNSGQVRDEDGGDDTRQMPIRQELIWGCPDDI